MNNNLYLVVSSMKAVRIGGLHIDQRKDALTKIIASLYSIKGQGGNEDAIVDSIAFAVRELEKELAVKYPFFTMGEVQYALEEGVKGTWETEQTRFQGGTGLNVANYCRWLKAYRDSDIRLEAVQAIENGRRITDPSLLIAPEDVARKNEECNRLTYDLFLSEVRKTGAISPEHFDGRVAALYNDMRRTGRLAQPSQEAISAAVSRASAELKAAPVASIVTTRAKRYLLQDHLRALCPGAPEATADALDGGRSFDAIGASVFKRLTA